VRRCRYADLVGKRVVDADGETIGRVADLVAQRCGESLCVVGLLVGPGALLRRIAFRRLPFGGAPLARYVSWECVDRIDRRIYLRPDWAHAPAHADVVQ
jgi:sporulation protein YlmC with PRC-barrel domain